MKKLLISYILLFACTITLQAQHKKVDKRPAKEQKARTAPTGKDKKQTTIKQTDPKQKKVASQSVKQKITAPTSKQNTKGKQSQNARRQGGKGKSQSYVTTEEISKSKRKSRLTKRSSR